MAEQRPTNLRKQTMASGDPNKVSFAMNSQNVVGSHKNAIKKEFLCALCQAILVEPWECKECSNRFHQNCLNRFAKETGQCPFMCAKPRFISIKNELERQLQDMQFVCKNSELGCQKILSYTEVQTHP